MGIENMAPIVVIGSGLAGITVVRELRKLDAETPVVMLSADDGAFYSKPNLSNAFAAGKSAPQLVASPRETLAAQLKCDIHAHTIVQRIDTARCVVETSSSQQPYSQLVLAVGAQPIRLPIEGSAAEQILSINNLADYARFRAALEGGKGSVRRVTLLGAGLIGCEFANDLRAAGYEVDVFDLATQPLGRLLPPQAAAYFRQRLEASGVRFNLGTSVVRVDRAENGLTLLDRDGGTWVTDMVLSAVGLRPETALASAAGLEVNRGIMVDRQLRASEPNIFAVGDCAEVDGLNLPYVMPIMQQARALAKTLSGTPTDVVYPAMPVSVKTPACPTVVCPPPMGVDGCWSESETADGVRAIFEDAQGELRGFALTGSAISEKSALATRLPAMF